LAGPEAVGGDSVATRATPGFQDSLAVVTIVRAETFVRLGVPLTLAIFRENIVALRADLSHIVAVNFLDLSNDRVFVLILLL